jgi:small subunit ribosomal protein S17
VEEREEKKTPDEQPDEAQGQADEAPAEVAEEAAGEAPAAEELAGEEPVAGEPAGEEPAAEEPAPEEPPGVEPAAEEPAEPEEKPSPKERRKRERSLFKGEAAAPERPAEERAEQRARERREKAGARTRWRRGRRQRERDRRPAPARDGAPTAATKAAGARKVRRGVVISSKPDKTITVRIDLVRSHPVYGKVIKNSATLHAHDERNQASEGDVVRVVECRPLSKLKRWRLLEIVEKAR